MKIIIWLFIYIPIALLTPANEPTDNHEGSASSSQLTEMKPCLEQKCYFSLVHKLNWETKPRPEKSTVSTRCSNELLSFGELMNHTTNPKTGETNALALLICRGTGDCDLDFTDPKVVEQWRNLVICQHHADELLLKWGDEPGFRNVHLYRNSRQTEHQPVCSMPDGVGETHKKGRPSLAHSHILTVSEADVINKQAGYLVHPGIPICRKHKKYVDGLLANHQEHPRKRTIIQAGFYADTDDDTCSRDPSFIAPSPKKKRTHAGYALQQFAEFIEVEKICFPNKEFDEQGKRSQHDKACGVRKMFDAIIEIVAGGDGTTLRKMVLTKLGDDESWTTGSSENFEKIMKQISAQYLAAGDRKCKITILSIVANSVPYLTVEKYIPNLSRYMYNNGRMFARRNNMQDLTPPEKVLQSYNRISVQFFIDFITSPAVMIGLPYGSRKVKLSDGTKHEIPNTIRQQSSTEIYEMYSKLHKNTNQIEPVLSKSTVFRILEVCAATDRKATTCVDYFTANGMEAFDALHVIVDVWIEEELTHSGTLKQLKTELFEAAQYLRTDYRLHVKKCSRVPDHCATLALSDPNDITMTSSCSSDSNQHKYDLKCDRCERVNTVLHEMKVYAEEFATAAFNKIDGELTKQLWGKRKEEESSIIKYTEDVIEMKKHYLRAAYTNQEREDIINNLQDNEALITMDFAQKYLPRWHREKQNDYFGKKGISYHISHVTANIGGKYTQHSFVHIFDSEVTQDSKLVVLTMLHVLSELKKVGIVRVSLRSDNAGAYHSATTINALHWLQEKTKVQIASYTFSEAQNGKSSSDRDASRVKRKAEDYVSLKDNNIRDSREFFTALKEGKLLNGMSIHLGSVKVDDPGSSKWTGISLLNHFTVEVDGIRGRRYGGIGQGQLVPKADLNPMSGSSSFEDAGFVASNIESVEAERKNVINGVQTKFWYFSECKRNDNQTPENESDACIHEDDNVTPEIDDQEQIKTDDEIGKLYSCPELGCSAAFLSHWNLEKHLLRGKHRISPEKLTLRDAAFKLFANNIQEVQNTRGCPIVTDALDELKETTDQTALTTGWALPRKQTRKPFETHVKKWLIDRFEEGIQKKRLDPRTVEKRMCIDKNDDGTLMFTVEERKDFRQIASFFSRESKKRREQPRHRHRRYTAPVIEEEYIVPEDEHDDAGWIEFLKDESFWTDSDEFFNAVHESQEPLFLD